MVAFNNEENINENIEKKFVYNEIDQFLSELVK